MPEGRGASGHDGSRGPAEGASAGAGSVFLRVLLVAVSASVPTALVDLGLVRGSARSVVLALAIVIVVAGIGSLYMPQRDSRRGTIGGRALPRTSAVGAVPVAEAYASSGEGAAPPPSPSAEPPGAEPGEGSEF